MPVETRYEAFLSYSHADREIAQWLHRALETYRLPKKLIGRETPQGPAPGRLRRIFKDREELSASGNLGAAIETALAASDALIVICSRAAAASRWVNEEIRNYKRQHGDARVLAVITDGEPFASNIVGRESDECFPQALRFAVDRDGLITDQPAEPIAADLRGGKDGKRLGKLKLIAGLTGVTLDELVRREAQRRAQRLTAVAVGASCLAVVMTALSVAAFRARNDARQQREQAEGLIEFMLVDLRKKLEPLGRLEALDVVGEKALAHYETQQNLDVNSLGHRSRALHLIGEIRQLRGNLGEALTAFQRAADTTAELLKQAPNDEQRIFDHAQSVFWVGNIARDRGLQSQAEEAFRQYVELAARLVKLNPEKSDWRLETAYAAQNLGIVLLDQARASEALKVLTDARDAMSPLVSAKPELANDLAHIYGWISRAYEKLGDYSRAIELQYAKRDLFNSVPDAGKNKQVQRGLQNAFSELARLELSTGRIAIAEEYATASVNQASAMVSSDPENRFWLNELCTARLRMAAVDLALERKAGAQALLTLAKIDIERLVQMDATKLEWQIYLLGFVLAYSAQASNHAPLVMQTALSQYLAKTKQLIERGAKLRPAHTLARATAQFELGRLIAANGQPEDASVHWREIIAGLNADDAKSDFDLLTLLARAHYAVGEIDRARDLVQRIHVSTYRHPAFAELVKEMNSGKGPAASIIKPRSTP